MLDPSYLVLDAATGCLVKYWDASVILTPPILAAAAAAGGLIDSKHGDNYDDGSNTLHSLICLGHLLQLAFHY